MAHQRSLCLHNRRLHPPPFGVSGQLPSSKCLTDILHKKKSTPNRPRAAHHQTNRQAHRHFYTKFYLILLSFASSGTNFSQISPVLRPQVSSYSLAPAGPYEGGQEVTLSVNGTSLSPDDRVALELYGCSGAGDALALAPAFHIEPPPALANVTGQDPYVAYATAGVANVVLREGTSWHVCYWYAALETWVDITGTPLTVAAPPSAVFQADFRAARITARGPALVYFNGTGLSDHDRYVVLNSSSMECPPLPYGGTPVTKTNVTSYKTGTLTLAQGTYALCYLRCVLQCIAWSRSFG